MSANVDAMVRAGAEAYRNGNKTDARTLLEKAIELDPYNEQAWLWLSAVVDTPEEQRTCLENVLVINPQNDRALMGLRSLGIDPGMPSKRDSTPANTYDAPDDNSASDFNFGDDVDLFADSASTGFDDIIATSSASSEYTGPTYTNQDYDDWMNNLNIGQSPSTQDAPAKDDLFGDNFDEDAFANDNFARGTTNQDNFASDDFSIDFDDAFINSASTNAFTDDITSADDVDIDFNDGFAQEESYQDFESVVQEEIFSDADIFSSEGDFYIPNDEVEVASDAYIEEDYFQYIPKEIDITRLPGEDEDRPILLIAIVLVLLLLNIGAVGMLAMQLVT